MKCDELKYYKLFHRTSVLTSPEFISVVEFGTGDEVYSKSEVDAAIAELKKKLEDVQASMYCDVVDANMENRRLKEELRRHKYKRCLAMARLCHVMWILLRDENETKRSVFYWRWWNLWNELADKFKEAK